MGTTLCSQPCSNGLLCSLSRKLCAICWWILKLIYIQLCKCKYALRGNYYVRQSRRLDLVTTAPRLGRSSGRDDDWGLCLWVAPTEPRLSHDSRLPGEPWPTTEPRLTTHDCHDCTTHDCQASTTKTEGSRSTTHHHRWIRSLIIFPGSARYVEVIASILWRFTSPASTEFQKTCGVMLVGRDQLISIHTSCRASRNVPWSSVVAFAALWGMWLSGRLMHKQKSTYALSIS